MNLQAATSPKVSIILVNYNTTGLLLDCLRSIEERFDACPYEIIVVDNATEGFTPEDVTKLHPTAKVVGNTGNVGFGAANNLGATAARGTYLWFLNTDTVIPSSHNLDRIVHFLDRNPLHAAASPKLVDVRLEPQAIQRSYFPSLGRLIAEKPARRLVRVVPKARPWLGWADLNFRPLDEGDVPVMVAAALFVRKSHFQEVGGFSPEYFMFMEDSDLCRKFAQRGYRVRFMPQATVVHLLGGSIQSHYDRMRMYIDSREVYFRKWSSWPVTAIVLSLKWPAALIHRRAEARRRRRDSGAEAG